MGAVDFTEWAAPALELTFKGRTYSVEPPPTEAMGQLLAAAVRAEINLGLVEGPFPEELQPILDSIKPGEHPALREAYEQMRADKVPQASIDRMAYYATFYWARGQEYADQLAVILFSPRELVAEGSSAPAPKG